jgi:hypothetical protein
MNNILLDLRQKAVALFLKTGVNFELSDEDLANMSHENDITRWSSEYGIWIGIGLSKENVASGYSFSIDDPVMYSFRHKFEHLNRAWSPYYKFEFPLEDSSVFVITNLETKKSKTFNGIKKLIKEKLKAGKYHIQVKSYGKEFLKREDDCGFTCPEKDRKALIKGVHHMKGNDKVPFEWKELPSEQLP